MVIKFISLCSNQKRYNYVKTEFVIKYEQFQDNQG